MNTLLANTLIAAAGIIRGTLASAFNYLNTLIKSGTQGAMQFHQEGIAFAREMGMNAKEAQAYTEVLTDRTEKLAMKYGVAAEQVKELQRNISVATSRQLMLNESQAEGFLQLNKLVGSSTVTKFTEEMMNGMGGQLDTVQGAVSKAYATAAKSGLNAQKVSEKIANNLSMANKLSFRTGIDGLTRMAIQAEKVGINLSSIQGVADKFLEIDDAIENSARLNMLGGNAAILGGNPLDMAYEANYDPEALMKRVTKMAQGAAKFDTQKGIATVDPVMQDYLRNVAKAIGMNPEELVGSAKKQASNAFKEQNISSSVMAGLTQEQRDFLINKSNVANGKTTYTANVNGKSQTFDLTKEAVPKEVLEEMMKYEGMSDRDIMEENARSLTSINEILTGIKTSITAMFAKFIEGMFPQFQGDLKKFGEVAKAKLLPVAQEFGKSAREIYNWIKDNKDTLKTIGSSIATIAKWMIKYWPLTLTVLAGKKVLGMASNLGVGKKLGRSAARGAAKRITNIGKKMWGSGIFARMMQSYETNKALNPTGSKLSNFGYAFKDNFLSLKTNKLAKATGAVGIGISAIQGLGAVGKYNDRVNEINNSNMSQTEKSKALEEARIDKNSEIGGAVGSGVGTILGTIFFGPLGAMIGGAVGQFAGEFIGKYWNPIVDMFGNAISKVGKAISSGFDWVTDSVKKVFSFDWAKDAWNGITSIFGGKKEGHANGGIVSSKDDVVGVAKGEIVLDKTMQENLVSILKNPSVQAKPVGEAEYVYKPNRTETSNVNGNTITVKDFNINISGTLKLDAGNYSKSIDGRELLNDHAFMTEIKNKIMTEINQSINNGKYLSDLVTMAGFSSPASVYGKR